MLPDAVRRCPISGFGNFAGDGALLCLVEVHEQGAGARGSVPPHVRYRLVQGTGVGDKMTQRVPGGPSGPVMPGLGPSGWAPPTPQVSPGPPPGIRPPAPPRRWLSILLVGVPAAFIVAVFAAVTIVPFLLRWESFIVTSASMTPSIPVGSVVVVDPSVAQKMQVAKQISAVLAVLVVFVL